MTSLSVEPRESIEESFYNVRERYFDTYFNNQEAVDENFSVFVSETDYMFFQISKGSLVTLRDKLLTEQMSDVSVTVINTMFRVFNGETRTGLNSFIKTVDHSEWSYGETGKIDKSILNENIDFKTGLVHLFNELDTMSIVILLKIISML